MAQRRLRTGHLVRLGQEKGLSSLMGSCLHGTWAMIVDAELRLGVLNRHCRGVCTARPECTHMQGVLGVASHRNPELYLAQGLPLKG